jgi:hypothetical protein
LELEDVRRLVVVVAAGVEQEPEPEPDLEPGPDELFLRVCDLEGLIERSVDGVAATVFGVEGEEGAVEDVGPDADVAVVGVVGGGNIMNRLGEPGAERSLVGTVFGEPSSESLRGRIVE